MNKPLTRVCVFTGSSFGRRDSYKEHAAELGRALAERGMELVYGGASVGLMGTVADAAIAAGAAVYGVLPKALQERELAHPGLTELTIVSSMHERKQTMADLSDGFVALPGGIGTLEELFEIWTWAQLGVHTKPIGILNADGYYDGLVAFLDHQVAEGFVRDEHRHAVVIATSAAALLEGMASARPAVTPKWIDRGAV